MHKTKIFSLFLICILVLAACRALPPISPKPAENQSTPLPSQTPTTINQGVSFTPTPSKSFPEESVRLAWFYKPPENDSLSTLSQNFDFFILTHRDEEERDQLRSLGVGTTIYQYLTFVQIMDPGSCTERPYGNQVAYQVGDFCKILQEHPDWFLRDKRGDLIRTEGDAYMDAGNPEYRRFWLERAKQMQEEFGWNGIFIDNVEASLDKLRRIGTLPGNYRNDAEYQMAIEGFLQYLQDQYFTPQNVPVMANIIELKDAKVWFRYMQHLDGAMIEAFSVDYNNRYLLFNEWKKQIDLVVQTQKLGKSVILVAQGKEGDQARQEFALGSYLLANDGTAFFRYTDSDNYEQVWLYDNYSIDLGIPLGPAYNKGVTWRRDFEKGTVIINPVTYSSELIFEE